MWGSAIACALFTSSPVVAVMVMASAFNGYFQSTGWAGTTKGMAEWTEPRSRGAVMGLWCTCYQIGGGGPIAGGALFLKHPGRRGTLCPPPPGLPPRGLLGVLP